MRLTTTYLFPLTIFLTAVISISLAWHDSPVIDEVEYIGAAAGLVWNLQKVLNTFHPPLIKHLAALGIYFVIPAFSESFLVPIGNEPLASVLGKHLLESVPGAAQKMVFFARVPVLLWNYALVYLFHSAITSTAGRRVAFLTTLLICSSPLFLSQAHMILMDIPVGIAIALSLLAYRKYITRFSIPDATRLFTYSCTAIMTKYSALILVPYIFLAFLIHFFTRKKGEERRPFLFAAVLFPLGIILVLISTHMIFTEPSDRAMRLGSVALTRFPGNFTAYWIGLFSSDSVLGSVLSPILRVTYYVFTGRGSISYFNGHLYYGGKALFYPALFVFKEYAEVVLFCLFGLGVFVTVLWQRSRTVRIQKLIPPPHEPQGFRAARFLFIFSVVYLFIATQVGTNIGLRYIFPAYVGVFFAASYGYVIAARKFSFKIRSFLSWGLVAVIGLRVVTNYPFYMAHFNFLSGGTSYGYLWAYDSNYDWGQDLWRLRDFVDQQPLEKQVYVDYAGSLNAAVFMNRNVGLWTPVKGPIPEGSLLALSAFQFAYVRARPVFGQDPCIDDRKNYCWLPYKLNSRTAVLSPSLRIITR